MAGNDGQVSARGGMAGEGPLDRPTAGGATKAPASTASSQHPESTAATDLPSAAPLLAPVNDERFECLLARLAERGMSREEFDRLDAREMPQGMTRNEAWRALAQIRRCQAVHYRDPLYVGSVRADDWFYPTHRINRQLRELGMRTCSGSRLDAALSERHGRRLVARSLVQETVATLRCDGLDIDEETARDVISGAREASGTVERLALNMHGLLVGMLDGEAQPITPELVENMYSQLMDGVDDTSFASRTPWGDEWPDDPMPREEAIAQLCGMASGALADPAEHPIIVSQRLVCKLWKTTPFPTCNYVMGSLLHRLHMKLCGYPAFVYVPSSSATLAWKCGNRSGEGVAPYASSGIVEGTSREWTLYWESCLHILLDEVDRLEAQVLRLKELDDRLLARLAEDRSFNHRQRDVLRRAILVPESTFRIEEHRRTYDLAYSTARQDLTTLMERGLLEMRYEGKAQVFTSRFDMKGALGRRYGA